MRVIMAIWISAALASAQPIARWQCDDHGMRGATLRDRLGKWDATLEGPRLLSSGLALDGARNKLTVSEALSSGSLPPEAFTVATWVRIDAPAPWGGMLSCLEDNGADENGFILGYRGARFMLGVATTKTGKITYLTGGPNMREGCWNHVVGTYDGKQMRLFVDGVSVATSEAQSGPIKYKPEQILALATYRDSNEHYGMTGSLFEVQLHQGAWTQEAVARAHAQRPALLIDIPATIAPPASAIEGWPGAMRDPRRSGVTPETLTLPLHRHWTHHASVPRSAWPAPARGSFWQRLEDIKPRNVWDHAFHPVAVGEFVYYGSSDDDQVRCVNAVSGRPEWTFRTGGPVRFAPAVAGDHLFVGSDDGHIYCLDRHAGKEVWRRRLGPSGRLIPGNGRLISPWPVRTGVAVEGDVVYATAGLFPREGCWVVALDRASGKEIWKHPTDQSPQGYLLLSGRAVFVPTGRGTPFAVTRASGASLGSFGGPSGAYAVVAGGTLVSGRGNKGELQVAGTFAKEQLAQFSGNRMLVTPEMSYLSSDTHLSALDRSLYLELLPQATEAKKLHGKVTRRYRKVTQALESGEPLNDQDGKPLTNGALESEKDQLRQRLLVLGADVDRLEKRLAGCVPWKTETPNSHALILADDTLFAGGDNEIAAFNARTGKQVWAAAVPGRAMALAVANGRLIVGTSSGAILAFGASPPTESARDDEAPTTVEIAGAPNMPDKGFVVVLGAETPFVAGGKTNTICVADDPTAVEASLTKGHHGTHVIAGPSSRLPDGFANAVVVSRDDPEQLEEARRIVRPWGGRILLRGPSTCDVLETAGPRPGAGAWTHMYGDPANTACSGDTLVGNDLKLQWFGGPGPNPMIDRHLRTTPPMFRDGRLFIPGHDRLIALDACNGTVLWEHAIPRLSRTGAPYDGGHMAVGPRHLWYADGAQAIARDPATGLVSARHTLPGSDDSNAWGWVCVRDDGTLFGTARKADAAIRELGREEVTRQYGEYQPLVTSHAVFRAGTPDDGDRPSTQNWSWNKGAIVNTTLTLTSEALLFVAATDSKIAARAGTRIPLADITPSARLVALNPDTGAELWNQPFPATRVTHSLFLSATPDRVIAVGSFTKDIVIEKDDGTESTRLEIWYEVLCLAAKDGTLQWRAEHRNNVPGVGGDHGEQVHHPVIRGDLLFTEPVAYHISTGARWSPAGKDPWYLSGRRGCGTFSASASCLYFRNHNPIALPIEAKATQTKITQVSRPGCWINILPVGGMVLLPEASSGCVCAFPIQTSMGFVPR